MRITWYGHAAFLIETQGLRIILDPYRSPDSGGYLPIDEPADLVIVSHENDRYHSHLGQIIPPFEVVRALELPPEGRGHQGHPVRDRARLRDPGAAARRRGHDHPLPLRGPARRLPRRPGPSPDRGGARTAARCRDRARPRGRPPTIDFPEIPPLLDAIGPRLVLPMHYKTPKINLNIQPLERFLEVLPGDPVDRPGTSSIVVSRETLPRRRTIVVLEHARRVLRTLQQLVEVLTRKLRGASLPATPLAGHRRSEAPG